MQTDPSFIDVLIDPRVLCVLCIYMIPTFIAYHNKSSQLAACFFMNLFFGWTLIGWFIACALAGAPSNSQIAHHRKVRQAKDEFYLREAEKARADH